jgi:hypothetical protein
MAQTIRFTREPDQALVHQFIRVVGRRPTPEELRRYQSARSGVSLFLPRRARRGLARLIVRL